VKVPLPNLDDRRWADLVEEGRALIPLYAPDWTDHNIHDPGITLMELLAWIAEMDIYQLNRIPDRHKRKFLALVGVVPEGPRAARTALSFTLASGAGSIHLPAGLEFSGSDPFGDEVGFRTLEALTVVEGLITQVLVRDAQGLHDLSEQWRRGESFPLFGADPQPGAEFYLGFDRPWPQGEAVNLFFHFEGPRTGEAERRRILRERQEMRNACRPPLTDFPCEEGAPLPSTGDSLSERVPPHHGVRLIWEVLTPAGAETAWRPLGPEEVDDDTRALTLDGRVRIELPVGMAKPSEAEELLATDFYYLRIRIAAGAYDSPPVLRSVALNGVAAEQAIDIGTWQPVAGQYARAVHIGRGDGGPNQELSLPIAPVEVESFRLLSFEPSNNQWRAWQPRPDFDASTRSDAHVLLDATIGSIAFGDGDKGRAALAGAEFFALYRATRAEAGNLGANTIHTLVDSPHNRSALQNFDQVKNRLQITNPVAASEGRAAETLDGATSRAIESVNATHRAVTLGDYEELAMKTPGVRLARASARANLHPSFPCLKAPGVITLVILPDLPRERPSPGFGLRRAVAAYLRRRRVIGTRVEVVGPTYLEVAARARVRALEGVNKTNLEQRIVTALDEFLDPLRGGPERTGWPFGRDVFRSEVMQVIDEVAGVDYVISLELIAEGCDPQCGNVCLSPTWLVAAGRHEIEVV
jgi:hypothetical protein